jgi:dephospho-CoA kinase
MPGAGKSTAAEALAARGWTRVVMGDVIREETRKRGLEPDAKNTGAVMVELRRQMGEAAVAELCLRAIGESGSSRMVVDGIRSMAEVAVFQRKAKVLLIAIHASRERRYALLKERSRKDAPPSFDEFLARDQRELDVGIGTVIALSDECVSNQRATPDSLAAEVVGLVNGWVERDGA